MSAKELPVVVKAFVGLGLASLLCQLVRLMLWWNASQELLEAISQLRAPSVEVAGHAFRIAGFFCGIGLIYFIARRRSRAARLIYLIATSVVIAGVVGSFLVLYVDIWGNKWGLLASMFQVGAASFLLMPGFRAWLREPTTLDLSATFS
jgi:hypothetical protein